jgi:hypothetical protein
MAAAPPLAATMSLSVRKLCAADRELLGLYTGDEGRPSRASRAAMRVDER